MASSILLMLSEQILLTRCLPIDASLPFALAVTSPASLLSLAHASPCERVLQSKSSCCNTITHRLLPCCTWHLPALLPHLPPCFTCPQNCLTLSCRFPSIRS